MEEVGAGQMPVWSLMRPLASHVLAGALISHWIKGGCSCASKPGWVTGGYKGTESGSGPSVEGGGQVVTEVGILFCNGSVRTDWGWNGCCS